MRCREIPFIEIFLILFLFLLNIFLFSFPLDYKNLFELQLKNPSLLSLYFSNFLHRETFHFLSNMAWFVLISLTILFLDYKSKNLKMYRKFLIFALFVFPWVNSLFHLVLYYFGIFHMKNIMGFSFLVSCFIGYLPVSLSRWVSFEYKALRNMENDFSSLLFLFGLTGITLIYDFHVALLPFIPFLMYLFFVFSKNQNLFSILAKERKNFFLLLCYFLIYLLALSSAFPSTITRENTIVNIFAHYLGFVIGYGFGKGYRHSSRKKEKFKKIKEEINFRSRYCC